MPDPSVSIQDLLDHGISLHCLRDLTRGGLSSALNDLADGAKAHLTIEESCIPVGEAVRGACEILGLDPLYVANEGRFVVFLPASESEKALSILRTHSAAHLAAGIGEVLPPSCFGFPIGNHPHPCRHHSYPRPSFQRATAKNLLV